MLVVTRFQIQEDGLEAFLTPAREAVAALSRCPGFVRARVGRALDDPEMLVLAMEWQDVGSYRRALSSTDVKMNAVPLLSQAIDEPSAFEMLHSRGPEGITDSPTAIAADGRTVRLGEAAGPTPTD